MPRTTPPGREQRRATAPPRELVGLGIPGGGYTGRGWITTGLDLAVTDPEDGSVVAHVHTAEPGEVSDALATVSGSLAARWEIWQRREMLERAVELLRQEHERIARIISAESSKTITEARREVTRATETLRLSAAAAPLLEGDTLALSDSERGGRRIGWNRREPLGIIAAITPFNDPLNLVAHKVGPGLIAGNAIVLKPAATTPLSALALTDVLLRAGMPPDRMAVLVATREASSALVSDPRVAAVSFTGGPDTGEVIARLAGARKILMELGGNNAVVVCADGDVATASTEIVDGAFGVAGQNCLSVQRVFVHESVYEEVVSRVVAETEKLVVGSKRDDHTDVGPLITEREAQRVEEWVGDAVAAGATVRTGGRRQGAFYDPTVLIDVPEDARILHDEVFGPVVSIARFTDLDDALRLVDDTDFGMQAGIYTSSLETALHAAERLHVGSVLINDTSDFRIDSMPFGGPRRSGVGREGVTNAVLELSEPKNVIINRLGTASVI